MTDQQLTDRQALEALLVDNPELEQLERLLDQFNIFEAIGAVRQELRHSDFLAFLLNPRQPHGLDDTFATQLLQRAVANLSNAETVPTRIDLALWDLSELEVRREWRNIDLLLLDEASRTVIVIENKVGSNEHSDQLARYRKVVADAFPGMRAFGIFLTPEGDEPSDDFYASLSYGEISELVDKLVESRSSTLGPDVRTLLIHYVQMLRRHILSESEIAELCRRIYRKHQRALDLIYEHRPDLQSELQEICEQLVREQPELTLDHSTKTAIRFVPNAWTEIAALNEGSGWTSSGRMLLFEWANRSTRLNLRLVIGPGPDETRTRVYNMAQDRKPPFAPSFNSLGNSRRTIYQKKFLSAPNYEEASMDDLERTVRQHWQQFLELELPEFVQIVLNEFAMDNVIH